MATLLLVTVTGLLALALLALAAEVAGQWLGVADRARELVKTALLDAVQVYSSQEQARLDAARQQTTLDITQDFAAMRLLVEKNKEVDR